MQGKNCRQSKGCSIISNKNKFREKGKSNYSATSIRRTSTRKFSVCPLPWIIFLNIALIFCGVKVIVATATKKWKAICDRSWIFWESNEATCRETVTGEGGQRGQVEVRHRDRLREGARGVSETGTDNDGEFNVNGVGLHFYTAIVVIVVVVIVFFSPFYLPLPLQRKPKNN